MELHDRLRQYNRWRRGDDSPQPDPKELGRLLDSAANRLEEYERALKVLHTWAGVDGCLTPDAVRELTSAALRI